MEEKVISRMDFFFNFQPWSKCILWNEAPSAEYNKKVKVRSIRRYEDIGTSLKVGEKWLELNF